MHWPAVAVGAVAGAGDCGAAGANADDDADYGGSADADCADDAGGVADDGVAVAVAAVDALQPH